MDYCLFDTGHSISNTSNRDDSHLRQRLRLPPRRSLSRAVKEIFQYIFAEYGQPWQLATLRLRYSLVAAYRLMESQAVSRSRSNQSGAPVLESLERKFLCSGVP